MNSNKENDLSNSNKVVEIVQRKRGRQLGAKIGSRPTVWVCCALIDGELIHESYCADADGEMDVAKFSEQDAKDAFTDVYGIEPQSILGPYTERKGGLTAPSKKRDTISISMPKLTAESKSAIYKGWRGTAYTIEGVDNAAYFMFGEEVKPGNKKKSPPPAKAILCSALEFTENQL